MAVQVFGYRPGGGQIPVTALSTSGLASRVRVRKFKRPINPLGRESIVWSGFAVVGAPNCSANTAFGSL